MRWAPRGIAKNKDRKKFPVTKVTKTGKTVTKEIWHYTCAVCGPEKWYKDKEIQLDHIVPIVNEIDGWSGFDSYIDNLLCNENNFQRLCKQHHSEKTLKEKSIRTIIKQVKKKT